MKTREEVEKLKANWIKDPCWDIEETEGFEEYKEELFAFSKKQQIIANEIWEKRRKQMINNASVFPLDHAAIEVLAPYNGLTKRELFASMAMQGMLSHSTRYKPRQEASDNWHDAISEEAVQLADALIAKLN